MFLFRSLLYCMMHISPFLLWTIYCLLFDLFLLRKHLSGLLCFIIWVSSWETGYSPNLAPFYIWVHCINHIHIYCRLNWCWNSVRQVLNDLLWWFHFIGIIIFCRGSNYFVIIFQAKRKCFITTQTEWLSQFLKVLSCW